MRLSIAERREAVAELRTAGMSQREIGAVLGVDHATVLHDLRSGENSPKSDIPLEETVGENPPAKQATFNQVNDNIGWAAIRRQQCRPTKETSRQR
jgi:hypothetical protein